MKQYICAYKQLNYYEGECNECSGNNPNRMCYITGQELKKHLQQFNEIMFLNRLRQNEGEPLELMEVWK